MSWDVYVGEDVWIEFRDPADDWRWYRVVRVVKPGVALLRGIDTPDGWKHEGDEFRAAWDEVRRIKFRECAPRGDA